ncbi:MAG: circularly permuted type 2 ATP-grasp protein, partial [Microthrixaceae bacterium]|nr:circularly permuted type 2 ATP-grasp protein [Microthrixaceae bacterium]
MTSAPSWFDDYATDGFFDEVVSADGSVRDHYRSVADRLDRFNHQQLADHERQRNDSFLTQGITFTVYGEEEGTERTFPMDLVPRIIPADEWAELEAGLAQRVTALNAFLDDLYVGESAIINDQVVPRWLVLSSRGYEREAVGVPVPNASRCLVAGVDVIRDGDGTYRALEDNLRSPSGISYVLENRA